jgi:hypothetical protein
MRDTQATIIPLPVIKNRQHWSSELTHSLTLKDGTKLVTLADAQTCLIRYLWLRRGGALCADPAMELVRKAAETGAYEDRKAATDQVASVLRWLAVCAA